MQIFRCRQSQIPIDTEHLQDKLQIFGRFVCSVVRRPTKRQPANNRDRYLDGHIGEAALALCDGAKSYNILGENGNCDVVTPTDLTVKYPDAYAGNPCHLVVAGISLYEEEEKRRRKRRGKSAVVIAWFYWGPPRQCLA